MPSLVPTTKYQRPVYPAVRAYPKDVFGGGFCSDVVGKVVEYLYGPYSSHSDDSHERLYRPGVAVELFCLAMPTVDAFGAEIELCNAIHDRAAGIVDGESIKVSLKKYLETHVFVCSEDERGRRRREIKSGYSRRTGSDVPLFLVGDIVLNPIQVWLYMALEKRAGNDVQKCGISEL